MASDDSEPGGPPTPPLSSPEEARGPDRAGGEGPAARAPNGDPFPAGRRRPARLPVPRAVHDRIVLYVVRAVFFLVSGGIGAAAVPVLVRLTGREDLVYVDGLIWGCVAGAVLIIIESLFSSSPIRTISAIAFGLLLGLILSLVFQFVVEFIATTVTPPSALTPELIGLLKLLTTAIFCYFGITVLLRTRDDFKFIIPYVEFRREVRGPAPLFLDTSSLVDGRILDVLSTGVLDKRLILSTFVLTELQTIADSQDRSLRERGRRGLDMLSQLETDHSLEVLDRPLQPTETVDAALIRLAIEYQGKVITTDFNLQKNAKVQNVGVININDLAAALKPRFVPGESLRVRLVREGDDAGQAVGFLRDGTMVVVEDARDRIGQEVQLDVTSSLQTQAGRMVFGKLRRAGKGAGAR